MKNFSFAALALVLAFQIVGCGRNNNDSIGTAYGVSPTGFESCAPGIQPNVYAGRVDRPGMRDHDGGPRGIGRDLPFRQFNWAAGGGYQPGAGFCGGCAVGEAPACNPGGGMYCVPMQGISSYAQYTYGGGGYSFGGYSPYNAGACSTGVGQICQVGTIGTCGQFGQCVQTASGYGICAN